MKFAAISDLHLDVNKKYPVMEKLAAILNENGVDILLIAGDILEDFKRVSNCVKSFEERSNIKTYYVPGNHDLWSPDPSKYNVDYIYSYYKEDERCLVGKTIDGENFSIVGDVGWYDYSFGNKERFSFEMFEKMAYSGRTWQDAINNPWTKDNVGRNEIMLNAISEQIKSAKSNNIIAVTHMLPIKEFTVLDSRPEWEYFNAFLGSSKLGSLFENSGVKYSISGHVHYRRELDKNGVHYICPCLGYEREWRYKKGHEEDLQWHLDSSIKYFEIENPGLL